MPKSGVSDYVLDQTNRVSTTSTYRSALVVASKKGPANTPVLVTGQTSFLQKFTPDEKLELGWDTAMYEAWQYLNEQPNLYIVRAMHEDALYGGCKIRTFKSAEENTPLEAGFDTIDHADFDYENDALLIYGADQGAYNDDLAVVIITDPEIVKLDGCFLIRVYKNGNKVEEHVCSLDPAFKNGFGVNCYAEKQLLTSKYIRCDVNDDDAAITDIAYTLNVTGKAKFENETIKVTDASLRDHAYTEGAIVRIPDIEDMTAYYVCTTAGVTEHTKPSFTNAGAYKETVQDGDAVWTLKELVKKYTPETTFTKGDIVTITKNSKVLNYRAKNTGVTSTTEPTWIVDGKALDEVEDGTILWVNQEQTVDITDKLPKAQLVNDAYVVKAYTYRAAEAGSSEYNITKYGIPYADYYLATKANLPETLTVVDPTTAEAEDKLCNITYTALYDGETSVKHYTLPKASKKDEKGAYIATKLHGGFDGTAVTDGDRIRALNTLKSTKDYTFQLVWDGGNTTEAYQRAIETLCENRNESCHGIISVPFECGQGMITGDPEKDTIDYRKDKLPSSSNLELYTTHQLIYDEFNDRNMYVSPGCFAAARIMDVAQTYGWHWASAGQNRGVINSLDNAMSYEDGVLDSFCDNQINPIMKEPGIGQVIGDDYTLMSKACAMQDAHISRYVNIYLRPRLRDALKPFLFEFNDDETRNLITKMLETFMKPEVASRAIQNYKIVCSRENNTERDIQNSTCNVWIYILPTYIIRWIKLGIILQNNTEASVSILES